MLLLLCADALASALGKISIDTAAEQTLLELLTADWEMSAETRATFADERGDPADILGWHGVTVVDGGRVSGIKWDGCGIAGTLATRYIPRDVSVFIVSYNELAGSLDTAGIPRAVEDFRAHCNTLSGSLCLETLPENIVRFDVGRNRFEGSVDISRLPRSVNWLCISSNALSGTLDCELAAHVTTFQFEFNEFDRIMNTKNTLMFI